MYIKEILLKKLKFRYSFHTETKVYFFYTGRSANKALKLIKSSRYEGFFASGKVKNNVKKKCANPCSYLYYDRWGVEFVHKWSFIIWS